MELIRKYRPKSFKQLFGQKKVVQQLLKYEDPTKIDHAILLYGPPGTGKTSIAEIIRNKLAVGEGDYFFINAASSRGIDTAREVEGMVNGKPMFGNARLWVFDEFHQSTKAFQSAMLNVTEFGPEFAYFIFTTTDIEAILKALKTRCTKYQLEPLGVAEMKELLSKICDKEKITIGKKVVDRIVEVSEGSAREALNQLDAVRFLTKEQEQLAAITSDINKAQAIELCRAIMNYKQRPKWSDISEMISGLTEEPEKVRQMILGYATSVLLSGGALKDRAYLVLQAFESDFDRTRKAGLVKACYEVCIS